MISPPTLPAESELPFRLTKEKQPPLSHHRSEKIIAELIEELWKLARGDKGNASERMNGGRGTPVDRLSR